ncbi:hypothetical protein AB0L06_25230 [Spirillospora sp. NPDC052269]
MSIRGPVIFQAETDARGEVPHDAVRAAVGRIAARYPQVVAWYGRSTGHWWAMIGGRLLEACTPWELEAAIHHATFAQGEGRALHSATSVPVADVPRPRGTHTDGLCTCGCVQEDVRPGLLGRIAGLLHSPDGGRDAA